MAEQLKPVEKFGRLFNYSFPSGSNTADQQNGDPFDTYSLGPTVGHDIDKYGVGSSIFHLVTYLPSKKPDKDSFIQLNGILNELPKISYSLEYTEGPGKCTTDLIQTLFDNKLFQVVNALGAKGNTFRNLIQTGEMSKEMYAGTKSSDIPLKFRIYTSDTLGQSPVDEWQSALSKYAVPSSSNEITITNGINNIIQGLENASGIGAKLINVFTSNENTVTESENILVTTEEQKEQDFSDYGKARCQINKYVELMETKAKSLIGDLAKNIGNLDKGLLSCIKVILKRVDSGVLGEETQLGFLFESTLEVGEFKILIPFKLYKNADLFSDHNLDWINQSSVMKTLGVEKDTALFKAEKKDDDVVVDVKADVVTNWFSAAKSIVQKSVKTISEDEFNGSGWRWSYDNYDKYKAYSSNVQKIMFDFLEKMATMMKDIKNTAEPTPLEKNSKELDEQLSKLRLIENNLKKNANKIQALGEQRFNFYRAAAQFNRNNCLGEKLWILYIYNNFLLKPYEGLTVYIKDWEIKPSLEFVGGKPVYTDISITCALDQTYSIAQWEKCIDINELINWKDTKNT